jgi:ATP phosphoribosyltransferase regulatory subunit
MGIELLGAVGPLADAEVIHIADQLLVALGLQECKISLNHIGIFNGLLEGSGLSQEEKDQVRSLIAVKDMVALRTLVNQLPLPAALRETLLKLPVLHGDEGIFSQLPYLVAHESTQKAVAELMGIYTALQEIYAVGDRLVIDMGILRGFDYYTGMIFEGYSPRLGYSLLGGGRYDRLLDQFGAVCPATGFAAGMERLDIVRPVAGEAKETGVLVAGLDLSAVSRRAEALRPDHPLVITGLEPLSREQAERLVQELPGMTLDYVQKGTALCRN